MKKSGIVAAVAATLAGSASLPSNIKPAKVYSRRNDKNGNVTGQTKYCTSAVAIRAQACGEHWRKR